MSLSIPRLHVYGAGILAARTVAADRDMDRDMAAVELRTVGAQFSESKGDIVANDGRAFHPDKAIRRSGWDRDEHGEPLPADLLDHCYEVVRRSLRFPYNAVGNNGGSTGSLQQLSKDYVRARWPGKTWGWGTLEQTMSMVDAPAMFARAVQVTNDATYLNPGARPGDKPITVGSAALADVLRVQNPKVSESDANYGVGVARAIESVYIEVSAWLAAGNRPAATLPSASVLSGGQDGQDIDNDCFTTFFTRR